MTDAPWDIITKYFAKQADAEEIRQLENWMKTDRKNEQLLAEAYRAYTISGIPHKQMSPDLEKAWQRVNRKIATRAYPVKWLTATRKYAAAAVILILLSFSTLLLLRQNTGSSIMQQQTEIIAPPGQKTMVVLPDSSLVWLNSGSSLKYKGSFNAEDREVMLIGEAYFSVAKDKSKRFRVKTGILNVDVYGTAFNVKNHGNDRFQEITVSEGLVGISDGQKEFRQLTAGDQALLDKTTNKISYRRNNPEVVSAWKNNELIFDNTPLEEVIKYLERWYGVNITIEKAMHGKHNYTFKIKTESLREMLEMMKVITPLDYEISGKDVSIKYAN